MHCGKFNFGNRVPNPKEICKTSIIYQIPQPNLNLLKPFIILMVRDWKGWDAVKCLNQSKNTPSWCDTQGPGAKIVTTRYSKARLWWLSCRMNSNLNLAQPLIILKIIYIGRMGCCDMPESVQNHSILMWSGVHAKPTLAPTTTKTQCGVHISA